MHPHPLSDIIPYLQVAISPVILISGVGLLLLTMTNRLGRVIDRSRQFAHLAEDGAALKPFQREQVGILYRRARLLRLAIALASGSAFLAAGLVIALFVSAVFNWRLTFMVEALFGGSLLCLVASLGVFTHDVKVSLSALKLELGASGLLPPR